MARTPRSRPIFPALRSFERLEQVRVLAHPLRLRLLELFAEAPRTTKQAADHLGLPPTRLYHHVAALEKVGLVRVRERRPNRGTIEKHYEAVARGFELDPADFTRGRGKAARQAARRLVSEGTAALALHVFEQARDELVASLDAAANEDLPADDPRQPLAIHAGIIARPERIAEMRAELVALLESWSARTKTVAPGAADPVVGLRARLTIVFAPEPPSAGKKESHGRKRVKAGGKETRWGE